jgi:hypothetical protein
MSMFFQLFTTFFAILSVILLFQGQLVVAIISGLCAVLGLWFISLLSKRSEEREFDKQASERMQEQARADRQKSQMHQDYSESFQSAWWRERHRGIWDERVNPNPVFTPSEEEMQAVKEYECRVRDEQPARMTKSTNPSRQKVKSKADWTTTRKRPSSQPYGVSARGAEELVADWLGYLGEKGVQKTQFSSDGGIDVKTSTYCCQVKNYERQPVGVEEVRALLGTAISEKLAPLLFTSSGLTNAAKQFCIKNEISAIRYDVVNAKLESLTPKGAELMQKGWYRA